MLISNQMVFHERRLVVETARPVQRIDQMMTPNVIPRVMLIAFGAFLVAVPWLIPVLLNKFWVSVIAEIMIWSLFAASVNLLFGYVGLLSFGQALYFGFGMYGVAIGVATLGLSFWPAFRIGDSRLRGDRAGIRHFRGAPDLALFRDHHRGVFSHLLFLRGIGEAADRRRRRHQFLVAADHLHWRRTRAASAMRISSTSSSWQPFRFASSHASRDPKSAGQGVRGNPRQ